MSQAMTTIPDGYLGIGQNRQNVRLMREWTCPTHGTTRVAITVPRTVTLTSLSYSFPLARAVHSIHFECPRLGCDWQGRQTPNPFFERRDGRHSKAVMDSLFGPGCRPREEWEESDRYRFYPDWAFTSANEEPLQYFLSVLVHPQAEVDGGLEHYPIDMTMAADAGQTTLNSFGEQKLSVRARLEAIYRVGSHVPLPDPTPPPDLTAPLSPSSPGWRIEKYQSSSDQPALRTFEMKQPSRQQGSQPHARQAGQGSSQAASKSTSPQGLPVLSATMTDPMESMLSVQQAAFAVGEDAPSRQSKGKGRDAPGTFQAQGTVFLTSSVPAERVPHDMESYRQAMNRKSAMGLEVMTMEQLSGSSAENPDPYKQVFFHDYEGSSGGEVVMVDGVLEGPEERERRAGARDLSSNIRQGTHALMSDPTGVTPSVSPTLAFWQMGTALHSQPPAGVGRDNTAGSAQDQPVTELQKRRKRDWLKERYDKARSHCSPN